MSRVGRYYRKHVGRHGGFHFAVLLSIVVITYVFVPRIAGVVDAVSGYNPHYYEPKDFTRQLWIVQRGIKSPVIDPWRILVELLLILLVIIVWVLVLPRRARRR